MALRNIVSSPPPPGTWDWQFLRVDGVKSPTGLRRRAVAQFRFSALGRISHVGLLSSSRGARPVCVNPCQPSTEAPYWPVGPSGMPSLSGSACFSLPLSLHKAWQPGGTIWQRSVLSTLASVGALQQSLGLQQRHSGAGRGGGRGGEDSQSHTG